MRDAHAVKPMLVLPMPELPAPKSQAAIDWDTLLIQLTHDVRDAALVFGLLRERPELKQRPQLTHPIRAQLDGLIGRLSQLRQLLLAQETPPPVRLTGSAQKG